MTDTLTYKNSNGEIIYELERIASDYYEGRDVDFEFSLTIHFPEGNSPLTIDISREDAEILQRVVKDALDNRV